MSIADRRAAALRAAKRAPKHALRAFVSHFINSRAQGPQPLPPHRGEHVFVRRGWTDARGKLSPDGRIVGKAYMDGSLS